MKSSTGGQEEQDRELDSDSLVTLPRCNSCLPVSKPRLHLVNPMILSCHENVRHSERRATWRCGESVRPACVEERTHPSGSQQWLRLTAVNMFAGIKSAGLARSASCDIRTTASAGLQSLVCGASKSSPHCGSARATPGGWAARLLGSPRRTRTTD